MLATASLAIAFLGAAVAAVDSPYFGRPVIPRPAIKAYPLTPGTPHAESPPRDPNKYCFVKPSCKSDDDAANILAAFHECNHGGTVVLDASYTVGTRLDLTFLDSVDVALSGTVTFSDDLDYWVANSFKYNFQNSSAFWRIGGRDVNIYGGGVGLLHGNGQPWWDAFAANSSLLRPILMVIDGLQGGSISGLNMMNSPNWFNWIANSSDVIVSDINIRVSASTSNNPAKNTDGWDTYRSDGIVIQNSVINNGDDCVSFKPNSTNIVVQGLSCNGSHGVSVGSLGQYIDEFDIVENVYIYNISMTNAGDMARIKVWPGSYTPFQPTLNGGGGRGYVKNVTYDELYVNNVDWSIELTQCYGQSNQTLCNQYPSNVTISDVVFKNMWGIASKKNDPKVGTLICSSPDKCNNIQAYNISISTPSGKTPSWICTNMDNSLLDINCII